MVRTIEKEILRFHRVCSGVYDKLIRYLVNMFVITKLLINQCKHVIYELYIQLLIRGLFLARNVNSLLFVSVLRSNT